MGPDQRRPFLSNAIEILREIHRDRANIQDDELVLLTMDQFPTECHQAGTLGLVQLAEKVGMSPRSQRASRRAWILMIVRQEQR